MENNNPSNLLNLTKNIQKEIVHNDCKVNIIHNFHDFAIKNNFEISGHKLKDIGDVKKGVYEGGFRIWECEKDLFKYLADIKDQIKNKNILDLGCGCGLNGILCLLLGANEVIFQDYNIEVLKNYTIPNILLNTNLENSYFLDTDWSDFKNNLNKSFTYDNNNYKTVEYNKKFDIIFGTDIIYEDRNYQSLVDIFENYLSEDGIVLIGTKSYYFGNNGSYNEFTDFIEKKTDFKIKNIIKIENKVSNIRYIIQLNK